MSKKHQKKGQLQRKLTRMVLGIVLMAFLLVFVIVTFTSYRSYQKLEISNLQSQLEKTAAQIASLQTTAENLARQILYDEVIEKAIRGDKASVGMYLYNNRNAHNSLLKYTHILDGIQELLVYSEDGHSFSSQEVRDPFNPASPSNSWFEEFESSGKGEGFSGVHRSDPESNGYTQDVVSYILTFRPGPMSGYKSGKIMVSIEKAKLEEIVRFEETMISGYCLYGSDHKPLIMKDASEPGYEEIKEKKSGDSVRFLLGDIVLVTEEMRDGWMLALEISGEALLRRSIASFFYLIVLFLAIIIILILFLRASIDRIVEPIQLLSEAAVSVGKGDFDVKVDISTNDEVEMLSEVFNTMVVNIRNLMKESVENETIRRKMQIENLLLQINPHFIYNTMNSIVYKARMKGDNEIADYVNAFISLLQATLRDKDSVYSTVQEELHTVENYLHLQEYRYPGKFTYTIHCPKELKECQILNVMIQPAVENAIFHGIAPKEASGTVTIAVLREEKKLIIRVEDDGVGMSSETLDLVLNQEQAHGRGVHGIGIANIRERIRQIYGDPYDLVIESKEEAGTRVIMTIPYEVSREEARENSENPEQEGYETERRKRL